MLDTMTFTKALAGTLGSLLIFLLGAWAADSLFEVGDHGSDHAAGYVIDTGEDDAVEAADTAPVQEEVVEVAFADVYADADPAAGERLWRGCQACHQLEVGANGIGPYLHGVVGREIASVEGYDYSNALAEHEADEWTPENISGFIEAPREWATGTNMGYGGMDDIEDRANLIAYLAEFGSDG